MEGDKKMVIPVCGSCGSRQIRTTKTTRVCVRCGYEEKLK